MLDLLGRPVGLVDAAGKEVFLPTFSADMQSLVKPDGSLMTGTGGGSSANDIAFTTSVPLTNTAGTYMTGIYTVSGPLVFTAADGAVRGAFTISALKADGTNTPDVSAFTEFGTSAGYLNTANILNIGQFFNLYGTNYVSWSQAANPVPIVAPTAVTLAGSNTGVVGNATTFTVGTDGVRSVAVVVTPTPITGVTFNPTSVTLPVGSGTMTFTATSTTTGSKSIAVTNNGGLTNPAAITWTVAASATAPATMAAPTATAGDTTASVALVAPSDGGSAITGYMVTSSPAGMVDSNAGSTSLTHVMTGGTNGTAYTFTARATNAVGTSAASPASNSVALTAQPRLSQLAHVTESGTGPYIYTADATTYAAGTPGPGGVLTTHFAASTDGSASMVVGARFGAANSGSDPILGVTAASTIRSYDNMDYGLFSDGGTSLYKSITSGSIGSVNGTSLAPQTGDIMKALRTGSSLAMQVARAASPSTFVTVHTFTGVPTGVMYVNMFAANQLAISGIATSGLA